MRSKTKCYEFKLSKSRNTSGGIPPYTYLWSNGATSEVVNGLPSGPYTVIITDSAKCNQTFNFNLIQPPAVIAEILADASSGCMDGMYEISAAPVDAGQFGLWETIGGEGEMNFTDPTSHITEIIPVKYGPVRISWTVWDANNCTDSDTISFEPACCEGLIISNAITPNGDGINDNLIAINADDCPLPEDNELTIFNRWGNVVFQTTGYQNDWNGVNKNGNPLPEGTYFYFFKVSGDCECEMNGYIDLRR